MLGHIGNWELTCRLSRYVQPNAVDREAELAREPRRAGGARAAPRTSVGTIWRDDPATGRAMLKLFRQGGTLGILIDQDIRGRAERVRPVLRTARRDAARRRGPRAALRGDGARRDLPPARPAGGGRPPRSRWSRSPTTAPGRSRGRGGPAHRRVRGGAGAGDPPPPRGVGLDAPAVEDGATRAPRLLRSGGARRANSAAREALYSPAASVYTRRLPISNPGWAGRHPTRRSTNEEKSQQ